MVVGLDGCDCVVAAAAQGSVSAGVSGHLMPSAAEHTQGRTPVAIPPWLIWGCFDLE